MNCSWLLLAYADDILILSDSKEQSDRILRELIPEPKSIGLEFNEGKCELLIRNPLSVNVMQGVNASDAGSAPISAQIGGLSVRIINSLKYLGAATLDRPSTVSVHIKAAYKVSIIRLSRSIASRGKRSELCTMLL